MLSESGPLLDSAFDEVLNAPWTDAVPSREDGTKLFPQCIGHRGFKARWPENSMSGFEAAVAAGAHALETDLHLSKDGTIVLSHDASLKRCFGIDKKIAECDWAYLKELKTLREPRAALPRLEDLLVWLKGEERLNIWLLLDIKRDDDPNAMVGALLRVLENVKAIKPWDQRLVLACWTLPYLRACRRLLPTFPLAHTSFFLPPGVWNPFRRIPNLNYNMFHRSLYGPLGSYFLRRTADQGKQVFAWTVNDESWMEWCIRKNWGRRHRCGENGEKEQRKMMMMKKAIIDGVITDDPALFLDVCERMEGETDGTVSRRRGEGVVGVITKGLQWVKRVLVSFF